MKSTILLAIFYISLYFNSLQALEATPKITVSATSSQKVSPDRADFTLKLSSLKKTLNEARKEMNFKSKNLLSALENSGIDAKNIRAEQLNIYPKKQYDQKSRKQIFIGIEVTKTIHVHIVDLDRYSTTLDAVLSTGVEQFQGVRFSSSKRDQIAVDVLAEAAKSAKAKAVVIVESLGQKLGQLISVTEGGASHPRPIETMAMMKSDRSGASFTPGEVQISKSITLSYEILE